MNLYKSIFIFILNHLGTNAAVLIIVLMLDFPIEVLAGLWALRFTIY